MNSQAGKCGAAFAALLTGWLLLIAMATQAQVVGSIQGEVTDATGKYPFADAQVVIEGERRSTVTSRDGRFSFADLAPGTYTLQANYAGAAPATVQVVIKGGETQRLVMRIGGDSTATGTQLKGLLISGQAAGQAAAISRRQRAESVVDVLSSDSVGNFPDQNVAEALQRAPGVSVQRDQGEGRFVVIRGIDPNFNTTTFNGMRIPGPESDSRAVNLDVMSSDLVESVVITKAITPDMDGDAVGGNIEVNTLTAFDLGGRSISATLGGSYNTTNEETSPDMALTYTDLFSVGGGEDNLGVAFAVSQFDRDTVSDGVESAPWELTEAPDGSEHNTLLEGEQRDYVLTRKRTSASLNFDYRPSDRDQYYLRTLYSEFDDAEVRLQNIYKFEDGDTIALDGASGQFEGAEFEKVYSDSNKIMEIMSFSLGGEHDLAPWKLDYNLGYAVAGEEGKSEIAGEYLAEGVDMGYSLAGDSQQPLFSASSVGLDPSAFILQQASDEGVFNEERELSLAFNLKRDLHFGDVPGYIQFGAKSRLREKENDVNVQIYDGFDRDIAMDEVVTTNIDYPARGQFGPHVSTSGFRQFFHSNRAGFELNEDDSNLDSRGADYDIEEDIHAGYVMAKAEFNHFSLLGGVRVERTDYSASGTRVAIDEENGSGDPELSAFSADKSYTHVLPGLHLNYQLNDAMAVRGALTKTIARPGFEAAGPWQIIEIEEDDGEFERVAESGNPDLDPLESINVDLRWEYYPSGISLVSAGVFFKDIEDFFLVANTAGTAPFEDFDEVIQTVNGGDAKLWGLELTYMRQFDFLPSPWDGLLMDTSYTWTDSESTLPERSSDIPLPGQSDHIASVAIGYEKYGFTLRIAAAYRSEFFEETDDASDPAFDRYQDDHLQIDITGKYRINDHFQVYLNLININDEPLYAYWGNARYNSQYEEYGPTVEAGVRLDF